MAGEPLQEEPVIVVYDCMLFFRAAARPERISRLFQLLESGQAILALSSEVLAEVREVLTRPEHQRKFPALTPAAVDLFLDHLLRLARFYPLVPSRYHLERDPKDSKYVNLAIEANANWLVTWDKDLLELADSSSPVGRDFALKFPQLRIGTGESFLRHIATDETAR